MPVQTFNDRSLANGPVPQTGTTGGSTPPGPGGSAKGIPRAVSQADGTANLGTTTVTKQAGRSDPSAGVTRVPKNVQRFSDGEV